MFGVLSWFSVLAAFGFGPAGAVFYRMSEFASRYWLHKASVQNQPASAALQDAAASAWVWIDWLPARVTALGFAIVGSFEDATIAGATTRSIFRTTTTASFSRRHPVR